MSSQVRAIARALQYKLRPHEDPIAVAHEILDVQGSISAPETDLRPASPAVISAVDRASLDTTARIHARHLLSGFPRIYPHEISRFAQDVAKSNASHRGNAWPRPADVERMIWAGKFAVYRELMEVDCDKTVVFDRGD